MITLRQAAQQDSGKIQRIVRQARINPTGLDWRRFVVAVNESGDIIGCVQIKPHHDGTRELASLAVIPAWQGQGVARALIEHMLARENGPLYLMCRSRLVPLYTKFGFQELEPADMPADYLRIVHWFRRMQKLLRSADYLAIMRKPG